MPTRRPWTRQTLAIGLAAGVLVLWPGCAKEQKALPPSGGTTGGAGGAAGAGGSAGQGAGGAGGVADDAAGGLGGTAGADDASVEASSEAGVCGACDEYGSAEATGTVANDALTELSGIAASVAHPGVFFSHNDSGDAARFFAFDQAGNTRGEFVLEGAPATDWEDMAAGPCVAGTCLYLADIGDNASARPSVRILRVTEPAVLPSTPTSSVSVMWVQFEYRYEDGPQNAETLMAHPITGDLYVVSKEGSGASHVYRIDQPGSPVPGGEQIGKIAELTPPSGGNETTAGAIHPCGDRFLLRTYNRLWEYHATGPAAFESAFSSVPVSVPVALETQGEAVAYLADGMGYVTVSEGENPEIHRSLCASEGSGFRSPGR